MLSLRLSAVAIVALALSTPSTAATGATAEAVSADDLHAALMASEAYPTAAQCGTCHPRHYREWSVSQHAYTQISPVFNAMQGKIIELTNGTNGDFCIRCHTPIGMITRASRSS